MQGFEDIKKNRSQLLPQNELRIYQYENQISIVFYKIMKPWHTGITSFKSEKKKRVQGEQVRCYYSQFKGAAASLQWCLTLRDPIDGSPLGSPVAGILQARTLEWVAISFSNAWKWKVNVKSLSRVRLLATPWTAAHQAPPSMGFSRQEYWSGMLLPSPKNTWSKRQIWP